MEQEEEKKTLRPELQRAAVLLSQPSCRVLTVLRAAVGFIVSGEVVVRNSMERAGCLLLHLARQPGRKWRAAPQVPGLSFGAGSGTQSPTCQHLR